MHDGWMPLSLSPSLFQGNCMLRSRMQFWICNIHLSFTLFTWTVKRWKHPKMIQTRFLFLVFDGASICSFRTQNRSTQKKAPEMGTERRSRLAFLAFSRQNDSCQAATQKRHKVFFWGGVGGLRAVSSRGLSLGSPKNQEKEIRAILLFCPFSSLLSAAVFETTGKSFFVVGFFERERTTSSSANVVTEHWPTYVNSRSLVDNNFRNFHLQTICASAKKCLALSLFSQFVFAKENFKWDVSGTTLQRKYKHKQPFFLHLPLRREKKLREKKTENMGEKRRRAFFTLAYTGKKIAKSKFKFYNIKIEAWITLAETQLHICFLM